MGATGLYLRTEDMVKLGILYLNKGLWKGTRVISEEWVDLVLEQGYEFKDQGNGWAGKGGMNGQMLTFHTKKGLAVAWHSYDRRAKHDKMIR
jgi:CubicO group peptidase (beta-lactamase class C family)